MPYYGKPIVGWVDNLGYIRCIECGEGENLPVDIIEGWNQAYEGEPCDVCGWRFPLARDLASLLVEERFEDYQYRRHVRS